MQEDPTRWLDWTVWQAVVRRTTEWAVGALPSLLLVLIAGFLALKLSAFVLRRLEGALHHRGKHQVESSEAARRIETLVSILSGALRSTLWCMIVLLALVQLGIDVAPLIAGAGLVGLAIGFGAQELVRDVISGFFMLLEDDVRRGDWAIINGTAGYVESVSLRTIVLRDEGGVVHVFQNGKIQSLSNTSKDWSAVLLDVAISYDEDVDRAVGIMVRAAGDLATDEDLKSKVRSPLEVLGVESFDDTKTVVRVRIKTVPLAHFEVGRAFRKRLVKAFHEAAIVMPEEGHTVHLVDQTPRAPITPPSSNGRAATAARL